MSQVAPTFFIASTHSALLGKDGGRVMALLCLWHLAGCDGAQSALEPAGRSAEKIAQLFWWMAIGAGMIWIAMMGLTLYATMVDAKPKRRSGSRLIVVGGAVVPSFVLTFLLAYGLAMMPEMLKPAPEGSLKIVVTGEQWWWRIRYEPSAGESVVLANEIRLPVDAPVEFEFESADVIHSFWIPSLGGKVDMIPGRRTRLKLEPTRIGVYRGACAEYCGGSHAWMAFSVVISSREDFEAWLDRQRAPALTPRDTRALSGEKLFRSSGCGACHAVRGTEAHGGVGPDLTHVGGRMSLGAGTLPNDVVNLERWLTHPRSIKPEVHMSNFSMLSQDDLRSLAAYLDALE